MSEGTDGFHRPRGDVWRLIIGSSRAVRRSSARRVLQNYYEWAPKQLKHRRTVSGAFRLSNSELPRVQTQLANFIQYVGAMRFDLNVAIDPTHDAVFVDENALARGHVAFISRGAIEHRKLSLRVGQQQKLQAQLGCKRDLLGSGIDRHRPNFGVSTSEIW